MASEKTQTAVIVGVLALAVILVFGGLAFFIFKVRAEAAQKRALEQLKQDNPVEYYVMHTPLTQTEDELRSAMVGTWQLTGVKSVPTGEFVLLDSSQIYRKTFTLTNWAGVAYDNNSNLLYTASGHYTLRDENYTESIEAATGAKKQFLGTHITFRIRLDGDKFYEMGMGKHPSLEQMWQRVNE